MRSARGSVESILAVESGPRPTQSANTMRHLGNSATERPLVVPLAEPPGAGAELAALEPAPLLSRHGRPTRSAEDAPVLLAFLLPFLRVTGASPGELAPLCEDGVTLEDFGTAGH